MYESMKRKLVRNMKVYILIDLQDTDGAFGANVTPFTENEVAQAAMREAWKSTMEEWKFDESKPQTDEYHSECLQDTAVIRDGDDEEHWRIEEHEIDVNVAVEVSGGLVVNVYANAGVDIEVYDLDVSDFPGEGEQEAADAREKELQELIKKPGWSCVW